MDHNAVPDETAYKERLMLSQYNPIETQIALQTTSPGPPFPPASDRDAWQRTAQRLGEPGLQRLLAAGEAAAQRPIPPLPAALFLEFQRTGERSGYENPAHIRRLMLADLVLAECLAYQGHFLDPILDVVWAICEESSWAFPAHQSRLTDLDTRVVDLGATMTALDLAEAIHLVGSALDPLLSKRVRDEIDRRIWRPYLSRHDYGWLHNSSQRRVNNWTAVCNAGVVGSALYLETDAARLAEIIARAARSLDDYLATFDIDGGSSEGPGYWDYGFGYYTILAHLVEHRTEGKLNFMPGERLVKIASYPLRACLSPGAQVNFSDCDPDVQYSRAHLAYLAERLNIPDLAGLAATLPVTGRRDSLTWALRELFWRLPEDSSPGFSPPRHDWFREMQWMVARYNPADPAALVLAAKGGHNGEMHNQNDVGNFIVHVKGESIIVDLGRGRYTRAYFGPQRYEHFVNASIGHSVPVPDGQLQQNGEAFAAQVLEHWANDHEDTLYLDLTAAYPKTANLTSLSRRLTLHREPPGGWVELVDAFHFVHGPASFETALITFAEVEPGENSLILKGVRGKLRVGFDGEQVDMRADLHKEVDLSGGPTDVRRVVFSLQEPARQGRIRLEIVPV
jgi:hypothetical protein